METAALIVLGLVALANIYLTVQLIKVHGRERSDMLDRLMSKDIHEYKEVTQVDEPIEVSEPTELSDEEEWAREIEMMRRS
jgi:hypothetical protein